MRPPRLGFLGIGWIGLDRMKAVLASETGAVAVISDPDPEARERALQAAPGARVVDGLDEMLACDLDGIVIATPSGLHADQSVAALRAGLPVFCQKPLGRSGHEVERIVAAARRADRLLAVDLSYRHTAAMQAIRELVANGELGTVHALDLVFHNAYGPDKAWFRDPRQSGGGCVIDLGIHLVDAALWMLGWPEITDVRSRLYREGQVLPRDPEVNEDFAVAELVLDTGAVVRLTCSWFVSAGRDAVIEASIWGSAGGAGMRNVDGSFYDFVGERWRGTTTERLCDPPDAWGGRALVAWARAVSADPSYDEQEGTCALHVAHLLDRIYGR